MTMTIDWNEAAVALKRDVDEHGGFLTLQKDTLRERFGIGRLAEKEHGGTGATRCATTG